MCNKPRHLSKTIALTLGLTFVLFFASLCANCAHARPINVLHYTLRIDANPTSKTLLGQVDLRAALLAGTGPIELALDTALSVQSIVTNTGQKVPFTRKGKLLFLDADTGLKTGSIQTWKIIYGGTPRPAPKAPWEGGLVWKESKNGKPWVGVACQGPGAWVWWPCKDDLADEPDSGASLYYTAPAGLSAIGNGHLAGKELLPDGRTTWHWEVSYPINSYCITLNIGDYACMKETLPYTAGILPATIWLLKQDSVVGYPYIMPRLRQMMATYQDLFGPYPWIKDGYQLVETDYWGMEHQSCVAYGNHFKPDAFGFDFILNHESAHEWWGNYISVEDNADAWVHEAFASYSEVLLAERVQGKEVAQKYLDLQKAKIKNLSPLQGSRGEHYNGWKDADIYYRGSGLLHTLNVMTNDSVRFIHALQAVLHAHAHKMATTESVLQVLSAKLGFVKAAFLAYALKLPHVPLIEVYKEKSTIHYYRLPGYTGPPIRLTNELDLDGTWRMMRDEPTIPKGWLLTIKKVDKR